MRSIFSFFVVLFFFFTASFAAATNPAPAGLTATAANSMVTLGWTAETGATEYAIFRGTSPTDPGLGTTAAAFAIVAAAADPTYTDTQVTDGTTYYYKVSAHTGATGGIKSAAVSATPFAPAPSSFSLIAGNAKITLHWTAIPDVTGYSIFRGTSLAAVGSTAPAFVTIPAAATPTYVDATAVNGTTYYYKVAASVGGVKSAPVNATPYAVPTAPTGLAATAGNDQVTLSWTAPAGVFGPLYYTVLRGVTSGSEVALATVLNGTTYSDANGLTDGKAYYYKVIAVGPTGSSPTSAEVTVTPFAPAPTGFTVAAGIEELTLSWTAVPDATGYAIFRGTSLAAVGSTAPVFVTIAAGAAPKYVDTAVVNGTTYYYKVAVSVGGVKSAPLSATPLGYPQPTAPTGLLATPGQNQVTLSWNAPVGTFGTLSYKVLRGTTSGGEAALATVTTGTGTTYVDTNGTADGSTFYYEVVAVGSGGTSPPSNEVVGQPAPFYLSFETPASVSSIPVASAGGPLPVLQQGTVGATQGNSSLEISIPVNSIDPTVYLLRDSATSGGEDWSSYGSLNFDVYNSSPFAVTFKLRIDDSSTSTVAPSAPKAPYYYNMGALTLDPGVQRHVSLIFNLANASNYGMAFGPGGMTVDSDGIINTQHIYQVVFYIANTNGAAGTTTLYMDNFQLSPLSSNTQTPEQFAYEGLIDQFGQNSKVNYAGKVASTADLATQLSSETASLAASPKPLNAITTDSYGGDPANHLTAPGPYFRTFMDTSGHWWLLDPLGNAFYAVGMDGVDVDEDSTFVQIPPTDPATTYAATRTSMFAELPALGTADPWGSSCYPGGASCVAEPTFNFLYQNIIAKYANGTADWQALTAQRFASWGINTVGNSSVTLPKFPYTPRNNVTGNYATIAVSGMGLFPDPYDPTYPADVATSLAGLAINATDPLLIGNLIDNELPVGEDDGTNSTTNFYNRFRLGISTLLLGSTSPAKNVFVKQLETTYGNNFANFQAAWAGALPSTVTSFATLLSNSVTLNSAGYGDAQLLTDMQTFSVNIFTQYYSTIKAALKKVDPNHLYLCSKFGYYTRESVIVAANYCDVITFDAYLPALTAAGGFSLVNYTTPAGASLIASLNKPMLISEFDNSAFDTGFFGAYGAQVATQADRGTMYTAYVQSVLAIPQFVGFEWYKYMDDPVTGRALAGFGNHNAGFITVTDTPYSPLINAARAINGTVYQRK